MSTCRERFALVWVPLNKPNHTISAFNKAWDALGKDGQQVGSTRSLIPSLLIIYTQRYHDESADLPR
jgi:hypothetical protein